MLSLYEDGSIHNNKNTETYLYLHRGEVGTISIKNKMDDLVFMKADVQSIQAPLRWLGVLELQEVLQSSNSNLMEGGIINCLFSTITY